MSGWAAPALAALQGTVAPEAATSEKASRAR